MILEDVRYIGRGEKQYPLGNSSKKEMSVSLLFPIFSSVSFSISFYVSVSLTVDRGTPSGDRRDALYFIEC